MRRVVAILAAALALSLTGCVLGGKQQVATITVPLPPKPVPPPTPAQPPPNLSIPQTQVELPSPQTISQEAMATIQPLDEAPSTPDPPRPNQRRRSPAPISPPPSPRPETVGPSVPAVVAAPAEAPRATIQEIVPVAEQNRLQAEADKNRKLAQGLIDQLKRHRLNQQQQTVRDRVLSFLKASTQAEQQGDMRKANELAENGLVLAKELPGVK